MSDVNYSVILRVSKDNLASVIQSAGITADMANTGLRSETYTLSSTATVISTANLSVAGLACLRNLSTHTASTCSIGVNSGGSFVDFASLRAGEAALIRMSTGVNYQAKGYSGTRLRVDITEG